MKTAPPGLLAKRIIEWYELTPRPLPWKESRDPYRIWISEIILQQTQVSQGIPYFHRFIQSFPDVIALANASEDEVLSHWQGLGYNSRARNLHATARIIRDQYAGVFPQAYDDILSLKGVGEYTAAAIASFAFGQSKPVLDSNVIRILSRIYGLPGLADDRKFRIELYTLLDKMIKGRDPADFNQAMMNFGALRCIPRSPDCPQCPLSDLCVAWKEDRVAELPVKPVRKPRKERYLHYACIHSSKGLLLTRRGSDDIWAHLYEFPGIEGTSWRKPLGFSDLLKVFTHGKPYSITSEARLSQVLTHQKIHCRIYAIEIPDLDKLRLPKGAGFVFFQKLEKFALPKVLRTYLAEKQFLSQTH